MRLRPHTLLLALTMPLLLQGCIVMTIPTFIHDKILGPASPYGNTRAYASQSGFQVTDAGVTAYESGRLWRAYPLDFITRGRPETLHYALTKGVQAFIRGFSPVIWVQQWNGKPPPPREIEGLTPGMTSAEVFDALGPPQRWIKRKGGSLMAYNAQLVDTFTFYLGTPPFLSSFVPVPGLNSLNFRYTTSHQKPLKTLLFFDAEERLMVITSNDHSDAVEAEE